MSGTPDPPPERSHPQRHRWWRWLAGGESLEGVGEDPDYRFTLANERTFLAWIRTALALVAGGVAVVQLVPEFSGFAGGRRVLGIPLILLAIVVSAASYRRWQRNELALRLNQPLPPSRLPWLIAVGLLVVGAIALVLVVFSHGGGK
jgi:putative membrane protein